MRVKRRQRKDSGASDKGKLHKLLFVNPKGTADMDGLAQRLISLRLVQEVILYDHRLGYAAKVRFHQGCEPKNVRAYISGLLSKDYGCVVKE